MEKELIGVFVTENPINKILQPFLDLDLPKIEEISQKPNDSPIKTVAVIKKFKTILTKKNNAKMAFVTLEDETGSIEAVIFPKIYDKVSDLLEENKAVYIEGKINIRDDNPSILVDVLTNQVPENSSKYDFVINIPKTATQNQLMKLNSLLKNNPNGHRGLIILPNGKNLPLSYGVNYNQELQEQIDSILLSNPS